MGHLSLIERKLYCDWSLHNLCLVKEKKRQEKNSHSNHYFGYWFDFFFNYSFLYHLFIFRCCCFNESTESAYPLYSQHKLVNLMKIGERKKLINGLNKLHKTGRFFKASIMGGENKQTNKRNERKRKTNRRKNDNNHPFSCPFSP